MARNQQRSRSISKSAPVGGLNTKDAINGMPLLDAVNLVNWIPQQLGVRMRKGYYEWVTGLGGACKSIFAYQPPLSADLERFAATDDGIFDVNTTTATPASVLTLSGAAGGGRMNSLMFTNTAGNFLVLASFEGGYITYDGTTWTQRVAGASPGQIDGVDPDNFVFVASWKRRLWFVEKDSTNAWYLDTDAIAGTATKLELGPFVKNGGRLQFITTWTIDAGEGIDDHLVFVFDGGDVLIYKGTDPNSITTFAMVGSYYIGRLPQGRRNFTQYGGDVLILSEFGIQPLSYVTRGGQSLLRVSSVDYTAKIQPRMAELVNKFGGNDGFDLYLHSKENLLLVCIPPATTNQNVQYALETNLNGWCLFSDIPIRCASTAGSEFWFGTDDGKVCIGFSGYFDAVPRTETIGNSIAGIILPAYDYFQSPGIYKHFMMVRPTFLSVARPGVMASMAVDFQYKFPSGLPVADDSNVGIWDDPAWDLVQWGGSLNTYNDWIGVEGLGFAGAVYLRTHALGGCFLVGIDYMYEFGGPL